MKKALTAVLLLLAIAARGQDYDFAPAGEVGSDGDITFEANHMTRGEVRKGALSSGDFASFMVERTMIGVSLDRKAVSTRLTAQHSGTWGSSDGGIFNVHEAWMMLSGNKGFFAKIGRQELSYDDQRIFGKDDWAMTARSHDVLKVGFERSGHKLHAIGAFNQTSENMNGGTYYSGGLQPYKTMGAAWYHYDFTRIPLGVSVLFLDSGIQAGNKDVDIDESGDDTPVEKAVTRHQQIYGGFLSFHPGAYSLEAAYYRQDGKEEHGLPIDAWMASVKLIASPWERISLYSGYDYLSGDEMFAVPAGGEIGMTQHDVVRGFSSIYGTHHKFYGAMDFFYVSTYVGGFTPGLQNIYIGGKWKPSEKVSTEASYHFLEIATTLQDMDNPLGHEIELSASFNIMKQATLSVGYSYMKGTDTMAKLKKTDENNHLSWGWIMLTASPNFHSHITARK